MKGSQIEAHLVRRVKALGGEVRKVQWIGHRGAPNRVVMLPEHWGGKPCEAEFVWVELRAPGKKLEPHQVREHARMRARMRALHQTVVVIDSIEAVERLLA